MARTTINEVLAEANEAQERVGEIYTMITGEVNADADLSGLTSTSKTAEFNLWKYIFSAMSYIQEQIWGEAKKEMQSILDAGIAGTDQWFQNELMKFQYGDALLVNSLTKKYYYAVINEANKIIFRCAVVSAGGLTQVKVAKNNGSGTPVALTAPELTAFASFMRQIQWAGANIATPLSFASDKLNAPMTIYYNGIINLDDLKPLVQAAFNDYLSKLKFNGEYRVSSHMDSIQAVPNVNDVVFGTVQGKPDGGTYVNINRVYYPVSGYIERDGAIDIDVMFTYIAQ